MTVTRAALSEQLVRLGERCRQLERLPDAGPLIDRTTELAEAVEAALALAGAAAPALFVTSLGRFQLTRAGRPLTPCPARRAVAVLRYLLTRPDRAAHQTELAESIWPASPPKIAVHNLHVAVCTLRQYLGRLAGARCVTSVGGVYAIDPLVAVVEDVETFCQAASQAGRLFERGDLAAAEGAHVRAVACYTGDYCVADLDFPWASGERDRHLNEYLATVYRLGRIYLEQRRYEEAVGCMTRILERDSFREDVYFHLMICYSRLGRRGHAITQYRRCADVLRYSLGIEPGPKLRRLHYLILHGDGADDDSVPGPMGASVPGAAARTGLDSPTATAPPL
jgi:DNA-binding SARP family transcriptional activator